MPATSSLRDCSALVTATREAGGQAPEVLTNIIDGARLLDAHRAVTDPARAIVAASVDGALTAEKLDELVTEAARAQVFNTYLGELRQRSERMFVEQFHRALAAGACDQLLSTLRPTWDEHAAAVAEARSEISSESSAEHILASGSPKLVACWQQLPGHLDKLNKIVAVARQFGPRVGNFPLIKEAGNSNNHLLEDSAIWCADGNLEVDSAAFRPAGRAAPPARTVRRAASLAHTVIGSRAIPAVGQRTVGVPERRTHAELDRRGRQGAFPRPANPYADADASVG